MRDNGRAMEAALKQRDAAMGGTAVDDMQAYARVAQTHADAMEKLVPAFQTLYDSMTPEQKANADQVFAHTRQRRAPAQAE
jgi:hypothetical protein